MIDWYVWFLLIVTVVVFVLAEYAVLRDRKAANKWKRRSNEDEGY